MFKTTESILPYNWWNINRLYEKTQEQEDHQLLLPSPQHFFQLCPDGVPGPDPPPGLVATHEQAGPLAPPLLPPVLPEPEPDPPGGPAVGVGLGGGLGVAAGAAKYCYKFCANKEGWIMKKAKHPYLYPKWNGHI